jgi:uncharacterized protein
VTCFVDSSALIAIIDRNELHHHQAARSWLQLLAQHPLLLTTNYVLLETASILQRRIGLGALETLTQQLVPVLETVWISPEVHAAGVQAALATGRRQLSVVDCISFAVMRSHAIRHAFAFDKHFAEQGFVLPSMA